MTKKPMSGSGRDVAAQLAAAIAQLGDRFEAEMLLCHVLERDRAWLMAHAEYVLDAAQTIRLQSLVQRRAAGEPVAYIMGLRGFWKMDLQVSPAVLIPRPETELLVEQALEHLPTDRVCKVADLGTGSGAVALAIASERPRTEVLATDASEDALAVARANADRLGLTNVAFAHGDWLQPLAGQQFDVIVSNPPYVAAGDNHLKQGDLRYEPVMALASGSDGLDAIRHIIKGASKHLHEDAWLLIEHGWDQSGAVRALMREAGFDEVSSARDLQQHERISGGRNRHAAQH